MQDDPELDALLDAKQKLWDAARTPRKPMRQAEALSPNMFVTPKTKPRYPSPPAASTRRRVGPVPKRPDIVDDCSWWFEHIQQSEVGRMLEQSLAAGPVPLRVFAACAGQFAEGWSYLVPGVITEV